jgi:hypothetical protein
MTDTATARRRPVAALTRRWPTALAGLLAVLNVSDGGLDDAAGVVGGFGEALLLLPLLYLIVTQIGRPRMSWPVLGAVTAVMVVLRVLDVVAASVVLVAVAVVLLVWGTVSETVSGSPHGRATFGVQAAGMIVFGAFALAGLAVDPDLGRYLVAAGWFCHGIWDFVHLRLDKIVSRTYAEWCGVLDVLVGAELLFLL